MINAFTSSCVMESTDDTAPKANGILPQQGTVYIRVSLPETNTQECLQFQLDEAVGVAKQQVIERLGRNLKDPLNYGLYCPPINGKAGKFLQEERPLRDYPLPGPIGFLEFKYKRRVYRSLNISQTKLKKLHTKGNLRQFLEYVKQRDVVKVSKWTTKGIDPNFFCRQTGETPLTLAVRVNKPRELIMSLVSGGAHLDFRSRDSATPLHKAAMVGSCEAITTLLDLGQSPNCRDLKGLTPLFYVVSNDTSSTCSDRLLYEHSVIGVADESGAQEVHHACRAGRVQHLQNLISYGADMNAQDKKGNTPLHVCALGPQDSCARLLLFRGADRAIANEAGQSPYQLAVLTGHKDIAELIKNYADTDVVPIKGNPNFNRKRRSSIPSLRFNSLRTTSMHNLNQQPYDDDQDRPATGPMSGGGTLPSRDARNMTRSGLGVTASLGKSMGNLTMGDPDSNRGVGPEFTHSWGQNSVDGDSVPNSMRASVMNYRYERHAEYAPHFPHMIKGARNGRFGQMGGSLHDVPGTRPSLLPLLTSDMANLPRAVVLQKGPKGFGFILRGAKGANALDFEPTAEIPALQYFEKVDPDTPASKAGLLDGDYILEINGENVIHMPHERAVQLIRKAGDTLALKVITVDKLKLQQQQNMAIDHLDQTLASYDGISVGSLRVDGSNKTASIHSRASRNITNNDLQEMFARAGRPELPGETASVKPDIVVAPKIYSDEADIKTRLRATISTGGVNSVAYAPDHCGSSDSGVSVHSTSGVANPTTSISTSSTFRPAPVTATVATHSAVKPSSHAPRLTRQEWDSPVTSTAPVETTPNDPPADNSVETSQLGTFAPDPVYETAAEFLHENKNATILLTSTSNSTALDHLPSESRSRVAVVANPTSPSRSEPVPDYSDSEPEPEKESSPKRVPPLPSAASAAPPVNMAEGGGFQVMLAAAVAKREEKKNAAASTKTAPAAPTTPATAADIPVPKKMPPPPPPPPPLPPVMNKVPPPPPPLASVTPPSRPPSESTASVQLRGNPDNRPAAPASRIDHEENLKAAIAQRRNMIDSGENPAAEIESRLRTSRQTSKSMVFGAPQSPTSVDGKVAVNRPVVNGGRDGAKSMVFGPPSPAPKPSPAKAEVERKIPASPKTPGPPSGPASVVYNASGAAPKATPQAPVVTRAPKTPGVGSDRPMSFLAQAEQLRRQMLEQKQKRAPPPPPPPAAAANNNHLDSIVPPPPDTFADMSGGHGGGKSNSMFFGAVPKANAKDQREMSML